ncbi:hypothetical protein B0H13DRAFT_2210122 [Mycena leptocephala]|nr:hypothetical protein B0H13DRAFT_2210122 [Mycena leptocephala]
MDLCEPAYIPGYPEMPETLPSRDLWFSDGNLILEAEHTSFRVYGQLVAVKSSVLADILALPSYTIDGIPVVRLLDADEDLEAFLKAILDSNFFMPPPAPTHLSTVLAVLRLSHKYTVSYLFRRALLHLDSIYPTNLTQFLAAPTSSTQHIAFPTPALAGHLLVLKTALDVNAQWFLPAVHYTIACAPLRQILPLGAPWAAVPEKTRNMVLMKYSWRLDRFQKIHAFASRPPDSNSNDDVTVARKEGCKDPLGCARASALCATTLLGMISRDQPLDPLRFWDEEGLKGYERVRCAPCRTGIRAELAQAQEDVWKGLPRTFECLTWDELRVMRERVMREE